VRLRKKLADAGASDPSLKSIRGSGYQLCVAIDTRLTSLV
jgi:DNA-binding response OmpR family regulator